MAGLVVVEQLHSEEPALAIEVEPEACERMVALVHGHPPHSACDGRGNFAITISLDHGTRDDPPDVVAGACAATAGPTFYDRSRGRVRSA